MKVCDFVFIFNSKKTKRFWLDTVHRPKNSIVSFWKCYLKDEKHWCSTLIWIQLLCRTYFAKIYFSPSNYLEVTRTAAKSRMAGLEMKWKGHRWLAEVWRPYVWFFMEFKSTPNGVSILCQFEEITNIGIQTVCPWKWKDTSIGHLVSRPTGTQTSFVNIV